MGAAKDMWLDAVEAVEEDYAAAEIDRASALNQLKRLGFDADGAEEMIAARDEDRALAAEPDPEPCTAAAIHQGCTCSVPPAHSASIDPPEPRRAKDCPLHGRTRDPDRALEAMRDREAEDRR